MNITIKSVIGNIALLLAVWAGTIKSDWFFVVFGIAVILMYYATNEKGK